MIVGHANAAVQVNQNFRMPVHVDLSMTASNCSNSPGPQITMEGEMALAGLGVDLIFTNNVKGTHAYEDGVSMEQTVVAADHTMVIPKQPVLGGVGGNPFMWIKFTDGNGAALSSELFLGRCVQGRFQTAADLALPASATVEIATSDCSNNPGPFITMNGAMELSALQAELIFRNNDNKVGGPHSARDEMRMDMLLQSAETVQFPKQPVLGGVGGNPYIWLGFLEGDGDAINTPRLLGRCVQLSK